MVSEGYIRFGCIVISPLPLSETYCLAVVLLTIKHVPSLILAICHQTTNYKINHFFHLCMVLQQTSKAVICMKTNDNPIFYYTHKPLTINYG